jgi:hypothetical protein
VLACVLASLLAPGLASASIGAGLSTRVGGLDLGNPAGVKAERTLTLGTHQGYAPAYDPLASGSLLAARGVPRSLGAAAARGGTLTRNVQGGVAAADDALRGAGKWLGEGYTEIAPGVFRSKDGLRQFRMTASDLADPKLGPHVHFEAIAPDGRTIIENSHVLLPPTP